MLVPLDHSVSTVLFARQQLIVELADGRTVSAPLEWFPILAAAPAPARDRYTVDGDLRTIIWPELGERVSTDYLLSKR